MLPSLTSTEILPYVFIFVIFFSFIFFAFKKTIFRGNKGINAIASLSASALIVWGLATKTDYLDFDFSGIGISPILVVVGILLLFFLVILVKGVIAKKSGLKSSGILFALTGLTLILGISPFIFSPYYLPNWLNEWQIPILIVGGVLLIWWLSTIGKKKQKSLLEKLTD